MRNRKCPWCQGWFAPHLRLGDRQRSCGLSECKRKQNLSCQKLWKERNKGVHRDSQRDWIKSHPGYWKNYRQNNPDYAQRNRKQSRIRRQVLRLGLQKKLDILEVTENTLEYWDLSWFAKQTRSLVPLLWAYTGPHVESHPS